jgi:hypothetical protein
MSVKTMSATSSNNEERGETGLSLIVIGAMLWFFDALVFFFLPAGVKLGQQKGFTILTGSAFLMGAVVIAIGWYLRKRSQ